MLNGKKFYFSIVVLLLFVNTQHVYAEWTYVYCAKTDQSDWYWLQDASNSDVTISGSWGIEKFGKSNTWGGQQCYEYFFYFLVSEEEYHLISDQCHGNYVPQPADNKYSRWHTFKVNKPNGIHYFAPGSRTFLEGGLDCYGSNFFDFESKSPWQ